MKKKPVLGRRQSGVVLLLCLIVLVVLLAGGVAVVRSMNTSLQSAGNLAFRRDLVNQGEQALSQVLVQFKAGGVLAVTTADLPGANYKASMLASNPQGIPTVLVNDATFSSVGTAADLAGATADVKIRYVVDRLCNSSGIPASNTCVQSAAAPTGGSAFDNGRRPKPKTATVYRVSIRVTGARSTQVFLQSSITKPD
ncbi:hypothetical protein ACSFA3_16145 [Variovorax sp. RHLX14]|uniref:hypothetical protein n=1 Tax=Variovorax sp. RHLX14 TaxID=1259731 RepID=UPI003F46136C